MSEFINTIDVLGDDVVIDSIIDRSIMEFKDDQLTTIGQNAFYGCTELKTLELPNLKTIPGYSSAFARCNSLVEIEFPNLVSSDAFGNPFSNCKSLVRLSLPKVTGQVCFGSLPAIKHIYIPLATSTWTNAFRGLPAIEVIDLPSVKSLGLYNFCDTPSLKALILRHDAIVSVGAYPFEYGGTSGVAKGTGFIYVPRALLSDDDETMDYRRATNWSPYASQFRALEDYTVDGTITGELDETKI